MTSLVSRRLYQAVHCVQQRNSSGTSQHRLLRIYEQQRRTSMSMYSNRLEVSSYNCFYLKFSLVEDVDLQVMTFGDYGKDTLKEFNLSPDGFIQNAIQLAYYKYNYC